ncbi:ataxin-2-like protein isoform X1 [Montipora foliosa]|uniref:ataxin-2-like protein isoform X1 n=1 Tax=Montipora foliosa TaxID=591990 RepID=UPI0035F17177
MSYPKHRNSKSTRGGNRGQRYHRPSSSPPLQGNNFVNIDDGFGNGDIYANKAIVYHVTSNLGEIARIVVRNGDIYEGILKAVSPKFDCTLGEAHLIPQRKPANGLIEDERVLPNRDRLISNLLIALKDIVTVNITKSDEPDSAIDSFTDEAIAGSKHTNGQAIERPLEKWVPQEGDPRVGGGLEDNIKVNGWSADEMFKTNQEKFGVTSTYSETLEQYTMPLPKDSTREMELRAEQTAREIEQSYGHSHRQEVDSGRTEEETFASVIRPKTTALASLPTNSPPVTSVAERQEVAVNSNSPCSTPDNCGTSRSVALSSTADSRVGNESKVLSNEDASSGRSPVMNEAIKDLKEFSSNFKLAKPKKVKEVPAEPETAEQALSSSSKTPPPETVKAGESKTSQSPEDSILAKSKLNPLAKEFKCTPKSQKPTPSPQSAQFVPVVPAQPFSPTSMRPPSVPGASPYSQQVVMVAPQQFPQMYRGKGPYNKAARNQSYGGREQGESPPFISAAAATGSPIIAQGGSFPTPIYQMSPQVAYVPSPAGMVPQQMMQQYVTVPAGHHPPRFIAPVSSPGGGAAVPMSQGYQDGAHVPVYVAGNMSALPGAGTPTGQPQPSPSQQGQFIFASPVPPIPGQPQAAGPHQGQVTPGPAQFTQQPLVYIPNASVSSSGASGGVTYISGTYPGDRIP